MAERRLFWRVQSDPNGGFDELVVGDKRRMGPKPTPTDGLAIHAEMTDNRGGYVNVCGLIFWFSVDRKGVARIVEREDNRSGVQRTGPVPSDQEACREAEELRKGIEEIAEDSSEENPDEIRQALHDLLDRVDARDSLAFVESKAKKSKRKR